MKADVVWDSALRPLAYRTLSIDATHLEATEPPYPSREFVDVGVELPYAIDYDQLYYRAAIFLDKIFRGAKAADLPLEQPTKFDLLILKAAKALGSPFRNRSYRANEVSGSVAESIELIAIECPVLSRRNGR